MPTPEHRPLPRDAYFDQNMPPPRGQGRPTVLSQQTFEYLLLLLGCGNSIVQACKKAGITPRTFHRWKRSDDKFANGVAEARARWYRRMADEAEEAISQLKAQQAQVLGEASDASRSS